MKNFQLLSTVLLMVSSILTFNVSAEIYTWTDENGKVHFSDKPINNEKVTTIKPIENPNISIPTSLNSEWQQDYDKTQQDKTQKKINNAQQKSQTKDYCDNLKSRLAIYQQGGRMYIMSPEGERNYQSEKELAEKKKKITKQIKQKC